MTSSQLSDEKIICLSHFSHTNFSVMHTYYVSCKLFCYIRGTGSLFKNECHVNQGFETKSLRFLWILPIKNQDG